MRDRSLSAGLHFCQKRSAARGTPPQAVQKNRHIVEKNRSIAEETSKLEVRRNNHHTNPLIYRGISPFNQTLLF
jgi:hypothetical protein